MQGGASRGLKGRGWGKKFSLSCRAGRGWGKKNPCGAGTKIPSFGPTSPHCHPSPLLKKFLPKSQNTRLKLNPKTTPLIKPFLIGPHPKCFILSKNRKKKEKKDKQSQRERQRPKRQRERDLAPLLNKGQRPVENRHSQCQPTGVAFHSTIARLPFQCSPMGQIGFFLSLFYLFIFIVMI